MNTLNTEIIKQYYYVKNGVIFDIKKRNEQDSCVLVPSGVTWEEVKDDNGKVVDHIAHESTSNIPFIKVTNNKIPESADTINRVAYHYLDSYIEDGDLYGSGGGGGEKKITQDTFFKVIHNEDSDSETTMSLIEYLKYMLDKELKLDVKRYFDKDAEWFNDNLVEIGIPEYLVSGTGYTVDGVEQISFTDESLAEMKHDIVYEDVIDAVNEVLEAYNYELVNGIDFDVRPIVNDEELVGPVIGNNELT